MAIEIPQFIANRAGRRLFSVLHRSSPEGPPPAYAVVFCAPLLEEKLWSHRVLVNHARFLAARGIPVLRFDYYGDGESEGRFEEASVSSRRNDILDAAEHCRQQTGVERVYLLGLCYGATLALSAALSSPAIAGAVAWSPVLNGETYANDLLRAHLSAQMVVHRKILHDREALVGKIRSGETVNIEGYEIGQALYGEMAALELAPQLREARKPVLLVQISPAERIDPQYAPFAAQAGHAVSFAAVRELKFWTQQKQVFPPCEQLFQRTVEWLSSRAA